VDVLEHQARHLVPQDAGVHTVRNGAQVFDVLSLEDLDVVLSIPHRCQIKTGVVLAPFQCGNHAFDRGLRCTPRQRRHRNVEDLRAGFDGGHVSHGRHAARAMRVDVDGNVDGLLERGDKLPGRLGAEEA